jgi:hypothetical protein
MRLSFMQICIHTKCTKHLSGSSPKLNKDKNKDVKKLIDFQQKMYQNNLTNLNYIKNYTFRVFFIILPIF